MKWDKKKLEMLAPYVGFIAAFYEYYAAVGLNGVKEDLEAVLAYENIMNNFYALARQVLIGVGLMVGVHALLSWLKVRNAYTRAVVKAIVYYVAGIQLAGALDSMSTYAGSTKTNAPSIAAKSITQRLGY